jgi:hypothetical protein
MTKDKFTSKTTGQVALLLGGMGILALLSLALFFVALSRNISALLFMGALNDMLNVVTAILSAALATGLHLELRRSRPAWSWLLLIAVWAGVIAVAFGSWLIQTGRSDVELSSYYFFFGNSLIGIWLGVLNRIARQRAVWPPNLTRLGLIAAAIMVLGFPSLFGILLRLDGSGYSPLLMITGFSFLGTGILYPIWALGLGRWILSRQVERLVTGQHIENL